MSYAIPLTKAIEGNDAKLDAEIGKLCERTRNLTEEIDRRAEMGAAMRRVQELYGKDETITFRA